MKDYLSACNQKKILPSRLVFEKPETKIYTLVHFFFPESTQLTFPYHQAVSASHAKGTSRQYLVDQWVKMLLSTINQVELKNNNL